MSRHDGRAAEITFVGAGAIIGSVYRPDRGADVSWSADGCHFVAASSRTVVGDTLLVCVPSYERRARLLEPDGVRSGSLDLLVASASHPTAAGSPADRNAACSCGVSIRGNPGW
jgi:hypothetical protein